MRSLLLSMFAALFLMAPSRAQDESPAPPRAETPKPEAPKAESPKPAGTVVADALRRLAERNELLAKIAVREEQAQPQGGNAIVIMRAGGGGERKEFTGDAIAWVGTDGVTVVQSLAELPGMSVYVAGETTVTRTTQSGDAVSTTRVRDQIVPLLDMARLIRHVRGVTEWNTLQHGDANTFSAKLPKDIVDANSGGGLLAPRVLKVRGKFRVGADGALQSMEILVTHNDPRREMMGGRVQIVMGPNGRPQVQPQKGGAKHDAEGTTAIYKVAFQARGRAPARMQRFKAEIAQALESADPEEE